jgi:hypothetical protein
MPFGPKDGRVLSLDGPMKRENKKREHIISNNETMFLAFNTPAGAKALELLERMVRGGTLVGKTDIETGANIGRRELVDNIREAVNLGARSINE